MLERRCRSGGKLPCILNLRITGRREDSFSHRPHYTPRKWPCTQFYGFTPHLLVL